MGLFTRAASVAAVPAIFSVKLAANATKAALGGESRRDDITSASFSKLADVLAHARGPMLKFGQALAMYSTAFDEPIASQLAALSRLYDNAEPVKGEKALKLLAKVPEEYAVNPEAVAAASLGQVHYGFTEKGSKVAVKVRYPDAPRLVAADMAQLRLMLPALKKMVPGLDFAGLLAAHKASLDLELDYRLEAKGYEAFKAAWPELVIPEVLYASEDVLVTEWVTGDSLTEVRAGDDQEVRDKAATQLLRFALSSPGRLGKVHADPHPGNYFMQGGKLAVLDFGAVQGGAGAFTKLFLNTAHALDKGDSEELLLAWQKAGFIAEDAPADKLLSFLSTSRPLGVELTKLNSKFMSSSDTPWTESMEFMPVLRFPPEHLLEHRAVMGAIALASSLEAQVPLRAIYQEAADLLGMGLDFTPAEKAEPA